VCERIVTQVKQTPLIRIRSGGWIKPSLALLIPQSLIFEDKPLFTEDELRIAIHQPYEHVDSELQSKNI
jgi:hypothetical protein